MKIGTKYNQFSSQNDHEFVFKLFPTVSLVGIFGHPVFYLICKNMGYYENLSLRIIASVLFIPMLVGKKFNRTFIIIYAEFVYTLTLPLFFSFLLYANDQNLYWTLSMLFAGGAFGFLVSKAYKSLILIPLSCMLSFVLSNFFLKITPVTVFYSSITTISITLGCALIMFFLKIKMKEIVLMTIDLTANQKFINETNMLSEIAEKNLKLQSEIHARQRLKLVAELSGGIAGELGNTLTVIRGQAFLMENRLYDLSRKGKLQTVCEITDNAAINVRQLIDFPQLGISDQRVMSVKRLITDSIQLLNNDYPHASVSIDDDDHDIYLDCSPSNMRICFYNLFRYSMQRNNSSDLRITCCICNSHNKPKLIINAYCSLQNCFQKNRLPDSSHYTRELFIIKAILRSYNGILSLYQTDIGTSCSIEIPYVREELNFFKVSSSNFRHPESLSIAVIINSNTLVIDTIRELFIALGHRVTFYNSLKEFIEKKDTIALADLFIIDAGILNIHDDLLKKKWESFESKPVVIIDYQGDRNLLQSTLLNNKLTFLQKPLDELSLFRCILQLQQH